MVVVVVSLHCVNVYLGPKRFFSGDFQWLYADMHRKEPCLLKEADVFLA